MGEGTAVESRLTIMAHAARAMIEESMCYLWRSLHHEKKRAFSPCLCPPREGEAGAPRRSKRNASLGIAAQGCCAASSVLCPRGRDSTEDANLSMRPRRGLLPGSFGNQIGQLARCLRPPCAPGL